jgi:hypothetical protein
MRQKTSAGPPAFDWAGWQSRLSDPFTALACHSGPNNVVHNKPAGDVFQLLGHIFTKAAQIATVCAGLTGAENLFIARQCRRQGLALRFLLWFWIRGLIRRHSSRGGGLDLFQLKLQIKLASRFRL